MQKKSIIYIAAILSSVFISNAHALSNDNPVYVPGGALSNVTVLDAFNPMSKLTGAGWWYFVGNLNDSTQQHSLQIQLTSDYLNGNTLYGVGSFGFTFKNTAGKTLYVWNLYPDLNSLLHYAIAPLSSVSADKLNYSVGIQSPNDAINPFHFNFSHDTTDTKHTVGQIGAQYHLATSGYAEIGAAQYQLQTVQYQASFTLVDERSMVPEGENGYVGQLPGSHSNLNFAASWEFTAPSLRVVNWTITITPVGTVTKQSLLHTTKTFNNNTSEDRLWMDRQMMAGSSQKDAASNAYATLIQQKLTHENPSDMAGDPTKQLYFGTWMAFCLDKKPFNGVCGAIASFWQDNTATAAMDSDKNATGGFINLFTPDSNTAGFPVEIGSTNTEYLSIQNNQKELPFQVKNVPSDTFTSPVSGRVYARTVDVTLRKGTVLAAVMNTLSKDKNKSYHLEFRGISKKTENIMINNQNAYYEGAAVVSLCSKSEVCYPVGTGFMEQMGY